MLLQISAGSYYVFVAAVFVLYWAAAASRHARLAVVLLANYFFAARYGLFYVVLLLVVSLGTLFGDAAAVAASGPSTDVRVSLVMRLPFTGR